MEHVVATIQELKCKDEFKYNNSSYTVKRKWRNNDYPLIGIRETDEYIEKRRFYNGLEEVQLLKHLP